MRVWRSIRFNLIACFILTIFLVSGAVGQEKRLQVWEMPSRLEGIWLSMPAEFDTTLPAPRLNHEPPYTWGYENTVYWSTEETQAVLEDSVGQEVELLFFEVEARYSRGDIDTVLWGFVDVYVDSATFAILPSGISIEYRLRYYAQDSDGEYGRSYWSPTEISIQDVSPPVLEEFTVYDMLQSGEKNWVSEERVRARVVAFDPDSGQIMQVVFHEKSGTVDNTFYYDVEPPMEYIDTTIPYSLNVPEHQLDTLSVWVVDVAEQPSEKASIVLFWWDLEDMVCFPNPFNPSRGETSTIALSIPGITEARIFDVFGNLIRVLRKDPMDSSFEWDGRNERGNLVSNGGYLCIVQGDRQLYCKIAVLR